MGATNKDENGLSHRRLFGLSVPASNQSKLARCLSDSARIDGARVRHAMSQREIEK